MSGLCAIDSNPTEMCGHRSPAPKLVLPEAEYPCFSIRSISLEDCTGVFAWALPAANPAEDPAVGRCLGAAGINMLMSRVQNAVMARGYRDSPYDLVPQIVGLRALTDPLNFVKSLVAAPCIFFCSAANSPHTLPYNWNNLLRTEAP